MQVFNDKYFDWNQKRIKAIIDFYGPKFFFYKRLLDLGCGHADISGALYRLGADITAVDARQNHLQMVKKKFPQIKTIQADLDAGWPFFGKSFDITLHLGLLCHLSDWEEQLKRVCASTTHLVLETTVCDSEDPLACIKTKEDKGQYDLSFNGAGCRPSPAAIERVLDACGMNFRRMDNAKLNSGPYKYDWAPQYKGECNFYNRRLWFCVRSNSPLQFAHPPEIQPAPAVGYTPPQLQGQVHISQQPLRLTKSPSIPHEIKMAALPAPTPQVEGKIRLFVNYYTDKDPIRKSEIDQALMNNIDNRLMEVVVIHSDQAPTFQFMFDRVNTIAGPGDISIVANADIYFDNSVSFAKMVGAEQAYALSGWDTTGTHSFSMPEPGTNNQDAWVFRGKIKPVKANFQMGKPGADAKLAYELKNAGYTVSNPALTIRPFHIHNSKIKNSTEADRVPGEYLNVPVIGL